MGFLESMEECIGPMELRRWNTKKLVRRLTGKEKKRDQPSPDPPGQQIHLNRGDLAALVSIVPVSIRDVTGSQYTVVQCRVYTDGRW